MSWQVTPTFTSLPYMWVFPQQYGLPVIGDALEGGFFAGLISHTADGNPTHALIVAPAATGATGTDYTLTTMLQWKTANTATANTTSSFDGAINTAAMVTAGIADHPAAQFCTELSIGGYTDWYLPAYYELDIAYQHLKPSTASSSTGSGVNPYSVPARASNRTVNQPGQTSITAFRTGNAEAFISSDHWSSTEFNATNAYRITFSSGLISTNAGKSTFSYRVRAFRRIAL
jgi:hypothetical protein